MGKPITTTWVFGWLIASSMLVVEIGTSQRSLNAAPRSSDREYTTCTRSRPRWLWRVIV